MAMEKIPVSSDPAFLETVTLSGQDYVLSFDFVERSEQVFFSLGRADSTPLTSGIALVPSRFLLAGFENIDRPPGDILVLAAGDLVTPAQFEDGSAEMFYLTDDDLARFEDLLAA